LNLGKFLLNFVSITIAFCEIIGDTVITDCGHSWQLAVDS
jgi:hypothetical protein